MKTKNNVKGVFLFSFILAFLLLTSWAQEYAASGTTSNNLTATAVSSSQINLSSKRNCNEILLSGEKDIIKTYRECLFQDWLESSPWKKYYNNSRLNDNAGIINNEREISGLLDSLKRDGIDITLVTINGTNISADMISYIMLASNASILLIANETDVFAVPRNEESVRFTGFLLQNAKGRDSEEKLYNSLSSLRHRHFMESNFRELYLSICLLFALPFMILILSANKSKLHVKILSAAVSFILVSSFTSATVMPDEFILEDPSMIKSGWSQEFTEHIPPGIRADVHEFWQDLKPLLSDYLRTVNAYITGYDASGNIQANLTVAGVSSSQINPTQNASTDAGQIGSSGLVGGAEGATYYVDFQSGSNDNNGTSVDTPWKHCAGDTNATSVPSSTTLYAGDKVIFKGGIQYNGTVDLDWSGSGDDVSSRIIYDGDSGIYVPRWASGTDKAIIDAGEVRDYCFRTSASRSYITINNFELRNGWAAANHGRMIYDYYYSQYITVSNSTIHDCGNPNVSGVSGIGIYSWGGGPLENL